MVQPFNNHSEANGGGDRPRNGPLPTAPPLDAPANDGQLVEFLVLGNKENYAVHADRKAILDSNTGLAQMLTGGGAGDSKHVVRGVDRDNFVTFVRYLETKFIKFDSPTHTLEMLELATRYQCRQLEIHCVKELDNNLHVDHVLEVYRALWFYNSIATPKAPPKEPKRRSRCPRAQKSTAGHSGPLTPEEYFAALLANCLQLIDMHAEEVFGQEAMLTLRFPELEMIVKRDALQLCSETVLVDLLSRWSLEDCKRKHVDPTTENRRRALGALCYAPRYLTMTRREFDAARERIELLDPAESQLVGDILTSGMRRSASNLTPEQQALVARFRAPRPDFPLLPVPLSARSQPRNYPKKMRKAAEEAERARDGPKKGCCNRLLLNCCSVFACIFD
uniref:BACK domain-containing protein n=1 Tax=Anopheles coluzzii TaxID=1518534 RepID=A0A6E8VLX8_ANOCL